MPFSAHVDSLISMSLEEDIGSGDITSEATIPESQMGSAFILAREDLLFCSHEFAKHLCMRVDPTIEYQIQQCNSGNFYRDQQVIARLKGSVRTLLTLERTLLNFTQRLSGIATRTAGIVNQLGKNGVKLLDTRKTTPAWRELEKYAVATGGGTNHRMGLFDAFLIKNNHVDALAGDIAEAIRLCRNYRPNVLCEVEVRDFKELREVLPENPDWILLDNMTVEQLCKSVEIVTEYVATSGEKRPKLEASGGYRPDNIEAAAASGVDAISMGWLTHSAPAVDISFRFDKS